jgi:hypothetical protein
MMKDHSIRKLVERVLAAAEGYFGPLQDSSGPRQATVYQEMHLGAAVGLVASVTCVCAVGASALVSLAAAPVGFCAGAVIGLMLWNSSADLPEDPVLPPARGQERRPTAAGLAAAMR